MGAMVQASQLGVAKVIHFGSEEQKRRWLPRFASGESLPTIAVTEPESGGHVLGMSGTATRRTGEYVLNGRKWFVGNSHIGDVHGVVLRTGEGTRGLSAFLVESDRPGFRLGDPGAQSGLYGFSFGEIVFEDCRIPLANRLGEEGQGLEVAYSSSVLYGRPNLTAVALGIHQAVVEDTVRFCRERVLYSKPLLALDTINLKVGEMQSRLMTARIAAYHAVHLLDRGMPCDAELINAKLINTEYALDSARNAMEIFAARGLQKWHSIERYLRDAAHMYPGPAGRYLGRPAAAPRPGRSRLIRPPVVGQARREDADGRRPSGRPQARAAGRRCRNRPFGRGMSEESYPTVPGDSGDACAAEVTGRRCRNSGLDRFCAETLVAHLPEVNARRLYRDHAFPSKALD